MRGLFIDPAGKSKPKDRGFVVLEWVPLGDDGCWLEANGRAPRRAPPVLKGWFNGGLPDARSLQWGPLDLAVCEAQFPGPKSSKQSLITLGVGAGFLLGSSPGPDDRKYLIPVYDWKNAIIPGFASAAKKIFTKNLQQMWPQITNPHCLDAAGLGFAFARGTFTIEQLKKWRYS